MRRSQLALLLAVLWTVPTAGLLVTSFRPQLDIGRSGWWTSFTNPEFTLDNYREALTSGSNNLAQYFVNSLVITLPAVVLPILIASLLLMGGFVAIVEWMIHRNPLPRTLVLTPPAPPAPPRTRASTACTRSTTSAGLKGLVT